MDPPKCGHHLDACFHGRSVIASIKFEDGPEHTQIHSDTEKPLREGIRKGQNKITCLSLISKNIHIVFYIVICSSSFGTFKFTIK